jgi:precorrin-6x reductase
MEWVAANTPEDAVIVTEDDVMIYLYTGRRAVPIGTFTPQDHMAKQTAEFATEALRSILRSYDVDYVVATTPFGAQAAQGLIRGAAELRFAGVLDLGAIYLPVARTGAP